VLAIYLAVVVAFFVLVGFTAINLQDGFRGFKRELQKPAFEAREAKVQAWRDAGHSQEWIEKSQRLELLRAKHKTSRALFWPMIMLSLACIWLFLPVGLVLTAITTISMIRSIPAARKEQSELAAEIASVRASMPEK
jgi:hypothetical protein